MRGRDITPPRRWSLVRGGAETGVPFRALPWLYPFPLARALRGGARKAKHGPRGDGSAVGRGGGGLVGTYRGAARGTANAVEMRLPLSHAQGPRLGPTTGRHHGGSTDSGLAGGGRLGGRGGMASRFCWLRAAPTFTHAGFADGLPAIPEGKGGAVRRGASGCCTAAVAARALEAEILTGSLGRSASHPEAGGCPWVPG